MSSIQDSAEISLNISYVCEYIEMKGKSAIVADFPLLIFRIIYVIFLSLSIYGGEKRDLFKQGQLYPINLYVCGVTVSAFFRRWEGERFNSRFSCTYC